MTLSFEFFFVRGDVQSVAVQLIDSTKLRSIDIVFVKLNSPATLATTVLRISFLD